MRSNTILLVALFAGAIYAAPNTQPTLKKSLGQMSAKNLAQTEWSDSMDECQIPPDFGAGFDNETILECPCNFTQLPGLGAGQSQGFEQRGEVTQVQSLSAVPDTQFNQICQTNCCECAESAHVALAIQAKNRTFTIQGAINVLERVYFAERERAAENSQSLAEKDTVCVTNNQNGGFGAAPECITIVACPPDVFPNSTS